MTASGDEDAIFLCSDVKIRAGLITVSREDAKLYYLPAGITPGIPLLPS
jgi:hypothetical protein